MYPHGVGRESIPRARTYLVERYGELREYTPDDTFGLDSATIAHGRDHRGTVASRDVANYVVSDELELGIVEPTELYGGPFGMGSLQRKPDDLGPAIPVELLTHSNKSRLAVLDYTMGVCCRTPFAMRTGADRLPRVVTSDRRPNVFDKYMLRHRIMLSDAVYQLLDKPLDHEVLANVRNVDLEMLVARLRDEAQLPGEEMRMMLSRLREIQVRGMITGESFEGRIRPWTIATDKT